MVLLELFSGIGGFGKGLEDAGFKFDKIYFSEIDKHAIANYKYNFKHAKNIGKVENVLRSGTERPDTIT
ncbi:MAG: DNA cytosine methyltransferase, partial [Tannerellaceae bacterium]|nr:DNA cytosine methyltransferase [Tannerellaceae bacterium]MDR1203517.1 DNA cytosine methyltransferase [Tannerellaceae bacterium]